MGRRAHQLNAPGDFYVEDGMCIACTAPEHEAPDLISHAGQDATYHCYFKRQPETPEELKHTLREVEVGCCGAVRYAGTDPAIIGRLHVWPNDCCDRGPQLTPPK